jgi:hypothetical protein
MALYRMRNTKGNQNPYVFTNPECDTIITHRDRVFVLGIKIPTSLQGDEYELKDRKGELELILNQSVYENHSAPRSPGTRLAGSPHFDNSARTLLMNKKESNPYQSLNNVAMSNYDYQKGNVNPNFSPNQMMNPAMRTSDTALD